jgi:hypothetical protein
MPENANPAPSQPPENKIKSTPQSAAPGFDAGHVPMTEELDSPKWTLPPIVPILIALAGVAIVVSIVAFSNRPKPSATGSITKVISAEMNDNVMVLVDLKFDNATQGKLWIKNITSELQAPDGKKYTDGAAPAVDVDRYLQAFPALAEGKLEPLKEEMQIPARGSQAGMVVFSYPVNKAAFDSRKAFTVRIDFYDRPSMILKQ